MTVGAMTAPAAAAATSAPLDTGSTVNVLDLIDLLLAFGTACP